MKLLVRNWLEWTQRTHFKYLIKAKMASRKIQASFIMDISKQAQQKKKKDYYLQGNAKLTTGLMPTTQKLLLR